MPSDSDSESAVQSSLEIPEYDTQFVSQEDDDDTLWEVIEILAERGQKYKVKWAGNDPATGKPWAPSWVAKQDCTDNLIRDWKSKQARKKKQAETRKSKPRASTASSKASNRRSTLDEPSSRKIPASTSNVSHASSFRTRQSAIALSTSSRERSGSPQVSLDEDGKPNFATPAKKKRKLAASSLNRNGKDKRVKRDETDEERPIAVPVVLLPPPPTTKVGPPKKKRGKGRPSRSPEADGSPPRQDVLKIGPPQKMKAKAKLRGSETNVRTERSLSPQAVIKFGPPRGTKRKRRPSAPSENPSFSRHPSEASGSAVNVALRAKGRETPETLGNEDVNDGDVVHHSPSSYWQFAFDAPDVEASHPSSHDVFSREGIVPETQSPRRSPSPQHMSQEADNPSPQHDAPHDALLATPPRSEQAQSLRASGSSSVISRMKRRIPNGTGSKSAQRLPALPVPPLTGEGEIGPQSGLRQDAAAAKRPKAMRPIPVVSPSVFHPHLQEPDPPPSSIEQFSSPEKGSERAAQLAIRRAQQKIKERGRSRQAAPRRDDENLRIRGQKLAEDAASSRRSSSRPVPVDEDNDWLFRSPSPRSPTAIEAELAGVIPDVLDQPEVSTATPELSPEIDAVAQEVVEQFVDYEGDEEAGSEDVDGYQVEPVLSLGPDLPGSRRKAGPLQEVRKSKFERQMKKPASSDNPSQSFEDLPGTSSTQQAVVDSQSVEYSVSPIQLKELQHALEEKVADVSKLEHQVAELQAQVATLKAENAELSAKYDSSVSKFEDQNHALVGAEARCVQLEQQMADLREEHTQGRFELQQKLDEQNTALQHLQNGKEAAEKERDIFREYYGKASAHASEIGTEKADLERELNIATGQLKEGLPMLKGMYEERIRRMQEELEKSKALCKVLMDKDERTNDEVRRRAALEPLLREENARLKEEINSLKVDVAKMDVALRPLVHHALDEEPSGQSGRDDSHGSFELNNSVHSQEDLTTSNLVSNPLQAAIEPLEPTMVRGGSASSTTSQQLESAQQCRAEDCSSSYVFACQYVTDTMMCYARFDTAEEVVHHAFDVHYPELQKLT